MTKKELFTQNKQQTILWDLIPSRHGLKTSKRAFKKKKLIAPYGRVLLMEQVMLTFQRGSFDATTFFLYCGGVGGC